MVCYYEDRRRGHPLCFIRLCFPGRQTKREVEPFLFLLTEEFIHFSKPCQYLLDTFYRNYYTFINHIMLRLYFFTYIISIMARKLKNIPSIEYDSSMIGQRISFFRKKKGFTQKELADMIGIKQTLVSDYETGRIRIFAEILARFSIALNVSTDDLLALENENKNRNQINLRIMKRINKIETLPETKKKAILKTIDDLIRANS